MKCAVSKLILTLTPQILLLTIHLPPYSRRRGPKLLIAAKDITSIISEKCDRKGRIPYNTSRGF